MQAITTKFLSPTNFRGARIKASAFGASITVDFDYGAHDPHDTAFLALIQKLKWTEHGTWYKGGSPDGKGNVYVCDSTYASTYVNVGAMVGK